MPELRVVKIPTDELVEYRNNAKLHPSDHVEQIAESIDEFGFNNPILAWHNDEGEAEIVAGHGRLMAARKLGIEELPVVFLDHLGDEARRAYLLVDNQLSMVTGFDFATLQSELDAITEIDMSEYDFDAIDVGEIDELMNEALGERYEEEKDTFNITFTFPNEHRDEIESYMRVNGKDSIVRMIFEEAGIS